MPVVLASSKPWKLEASGEVKMELVAHLIYLTVTKKGFRVVEFRNKVRNKVVIGT